MADYPRWAYYPTRDKPPEWVAEFIDIVSSVKPAVDSSRVKGLNSDAVLKHLRPGLESIGYRIEAGKKAADKITLPVLFGEQGVPRVHYDVDGVHDDLGILLEVEAGPGAQSNAIYRDLIRTSLIVDANFLVLGVMIEYHSKSGGKPVISRSYRDVKDQLDAIYASRRLKLPFEGVLLFGY